MGDMTPRTNAGFRAPREGDAGEGGEGAVRQRAPTRSSFTAFMARWYSRGACAVVDTKDEEKERETGRPGGVRREEASTPMRQVEVNQPRATCAQCAPGPQSHLPGILCLSLPGRQHLSPFAIPRLGFAQLREARRSTSAGFESTLSHAMPMPPSRRLI